MLSAHQLQRPSHPPPARPGSPRTAASRPAGAAVAVALLVAALLSACGSSSSPASSAEVKRTCREVEAVLSDGPEPAADPIGYAQAQVLPLRRIHTSDKKLRGAIYGLAGAYQALSAEPHVEPAATGAVEAAVARVNATCPGAAS